MNQQVQLLAVAARPDFQKGNQMSAGVRGDPPQRDRQPQELAHTLRHAIQPANPILFLTNRLDALGQGRRDPAGQFKHLRSIVHTCRPEPVSVGWCDVRGSFCTVPLQLGRSFDQDESHVEVE